MSAQDFYLNGLDMSANAITATLAGDDTASFSGDATANMDVPIDVLKSIFKFQSDSADIDNVVLTDIQYKVVDPTTTWTYSPADAEVDGSAIHSGATEKKVQYDWVRYLAQELFGTHYGVDLFTNETEIRSNLVDDSLAALKARFTYLAGLGASGVLTDNDDLDADVLTHINPSRQILRQIINKDPARLASGNAANTLTNTDDFVSVPLIVGDKMYFKFTANAAAGQRSIVNETGDISARSYLIKINVVA